MIEAVFLFVAYMNGSQTITQMPDMQTCREVSRAVRYSAGTGHNVQGATEVTPVEIRCITVKDGKLVPLNGAKSAAPEKE